MTIYFYVNCNMANGGRSGGLQIIWNTDVIINRVLLSCALRAQVKESKIRSFS